jgi:hypothetical protein
VVEGKSSRSAPMGEDAVGGEPGGGGSCAFPAWRSSVASPGSVVAASRMEVVPELPLAVALICGELPALPPPAAVGRGEVIPVLPPLAAVGCGEVILVHRPPAAVGHGEVIPALPAPASAHCDGLVAPMSRPLLNEAHV